MTANSDNAKHPEPAKPQPVAPLPRLRLPGVSDTDDAKADTGGGRTRKRGGRDNGLHAKDRRGNAGRDQLKFVPRRGGG
ncbi:MAG TPA: hypothetical protein VGL93_15615 [Streptosporangiaceae bacterium]|jgi:hypothetical protein